MRSGIYLTMSVWEPPWGLLGHKGPPHFTASDDLFDSLSALKYVCVCGQGVTTMAASSYGLCEAKGVWKKKTGDCGEPRDVV